MYTLLIVDDEHIICNGLKEYINWELLKINSVYAVNSVDEALDFLSDNYIDIVITDIRMPIHDGIYLTENIKMYYPDIKVLMLSGYDDFEYAKRAIHLGVEDYLSKPVDFDELTQAVAKVIEKIEEEKQIWKIKDEYNRHKIDQFFTDLVFGKKPNKSFSSIPIMMPKGNYYILRMLIVEKGVLSEYKHKIRVAINEVTKENNAISAYYLFNNIAQELTMIVYTQTEAQLSELTTSILEKLKFTVTFGVSLQKKSLNNIADAYNEAGNALDYQFIKNRCNIIYYSEIKQIFLEPSTKFTEIQKKIIELLPQGNHALRLYIYSVLDGLRSDNVIDSTVYATLVRIYICIFNYYSRLNQEHHIDVYTHIRRLLSSNSYNEIKDALSDYLECCSRYELQGESMKKNIIEQAQIYIENYYYQNITLNLLAETFYIHPNYFSRLFKEKTGENFSKYLLNVRLKVAKKLLLNNNLKTYQIAEMVGYGSKKYFIKVFKEVTGLTPKEYRDKMISSNIECI